MSTAAAPKPASESKKKLKVPVKQRTASFADPLKYRILTDEETIFTKTKAFAFLELKTFDGERNVRERHVQFLFDEWAAGRFLWQNVLLASAVFNNEEYRINGQHTCWMRVNVPDSAEPLTAKIRRMTYAVQDMEQLRALYAAFDRNAPRTAGHVSKVLLMDTPATEGLPTSYIQKLVSGFRVYFSPDTFNRSHLSVPDLTAMIEKNFAQQFNLVGRFFTLHYADDPFLRRAAVLGAVFAIFEKNVKAGDEFWSSVCTGLNLEKKSDPRWVLRKFLQEHGHYGTQKEFITQEQMYCVCINAWNHWRSGSECTFLKPTDVRSKVKA